MKMLTEEELRAMLTRAYSAGLIEGMKTSTKWRTSEAREQLALDYVDIVCPRTW